jgi:hypothetical protein
MRSVERHLPKIGIPLTVRATSHGKFNGWYRLIISGTLGKLILKGCSWGYNGEGCRATESVLRYLGLNPWEVSDALRSSNDDVGTEKGRNKTFFKFHLLPQ